MQGSNNIIDGNEIYNFPSWGIHGYSGYVEKPNSNIIRKNIIHDFGSGDSRSSGILIYVGNGNQVYDNLIYNGSQGIAIGPVLLIHRSIITTCTICSNRRLRIAIQVRSGPF